MNPKVDSYFAKSEKWQEEIKQLREIILDCKLSEELKWGCPCYVMGKRNIVLIHKFKNYCAVLFFKGALLEDKQKVLIQQTERVKLPRQIRFTNVEEIIKLKNVVQDYIFEACKIEKSSVS